jgi:hypothetical protein
MIVLTALAAVQCSDMGKNPGPDVNDPPHITSSANAVAVETETFTYKATAADPDGTIPAIEIENIPGWLTADADSISGMTPVDAADTTFWVIASDGELADTLIVTVTIAAGGISYTSEINPVFVNNCAVAGCHTGPNPAQDLTLDSYSLLMQGSIRGTVVVPFQPDSSIVIQQIEGTRQPQMPMGRTPLSTTTIQKIRDWIAQGARNN